MAKACSILLLLSLIAAQGAAPTTPAELRQRVAELRHYLPYLRSLPTVALTPTRLPEKN